MPNLMDKLRAFSNDRMGLANELLYAIFVLAVMAILWMAFGPGVSKILEFSNSLADAGMLSPLILDTINTVIWFFWLFPVLVCVCVGLYVIRLSQKRSPGDDF